MLDILTLFFHTSITDIANLFAFAHETFQITHSFTTMDSLEICLNQYAAIVSKRQTVEISCFWKQTVPDRAPE